MSNIILKIAEHTRLCKEYTDLPLNAATQEEYSYIDKKRQEIKAKIDVLRAEIEQLRKEDKN